MQTNSQAYNSAIIAPARELRAKVSVDVGADQPVIYTQSDNIKSITITRSSEKSKFFGTVVSQKLSLVLLDNDRSISFAKDNSLSVYLGCVTGHTTEETVEYKSFPKFYINRIDRNENTNELTIEAFDLFENAKSAQVRNIALTAPYSIEDFVDSCCEFLGIEADLSYIATESEPLFELVYANGANLSGDETIYDALRQIAEITGTFCYINYDNKLVFKTFGDTLNISKSEYFNLTNGNINTLKTIYSVTELGDNVYVTVDETGTTYQYIRNNAFLDLREDKEAILQTLASVPFAAIPEYDVKWRGNPSFEVIDYLSLPQKDDTTIALLNIGDTISYTGGLSQSANWKLDPEVKENNAAPVTIGDKINQTVAKVDKINNEISLRATRIEERVDDLGTRLYNVEQSAILTVTPDAITQEIKEATENINKVSSTMGTFDADGLTIRKYSEGTLVDGLETNLNNNGLVIRKESVDMLTASDQGVNATNLRTRNFLEIDDSCRFEEYVGDRVAVFWVGGNN